MLSASLWWILQLVGCNAPSELHRQPSMLNLDLVNKVVKLG